MDLPSRRPESVGHQRRRPDVINACPAARFRTSTASKPTGALRNSPWWLSSATAPVRRHGPNATPATSLTVPGPVSFCQQDDSDCPRNDAGCHHNWTRRCPLPRKRRGPGRPAETDSSSRRLRIFLTGVKPAASPITHPHVPRPPRPGSLPPCGGPTRGVVQRSA